MSSRRFEKHIFVCVNERPPENTKGCCSAKGGYDIRLAFAKLIAEHGLKSKVRANKSGCLDSCELGATVVIYPEGYWYTEVSPEDVLEIFEKSVLKDEPVSRLLADHKTWHRLRVIRDKN
ncbi:MAG: ferredoxin [Fidelibacterota bacterium]